MLDGKHILTSVSLVKFHLVVAPFVHRLLGMLPLTSMKFSPLALPRRGDLRGPPVSATKFPYDPSLALHRRHLAQRIVNVCLTAGFAEEAITVRKANVRERVFYRAVDGAPGIRIQVWTTVEGDEVRSSGADAIRVCAVYRNKKGEDRGIVAATRTHRVGTVDDICDRLLIRMRETYKKARRPTRCSRCGAPTFKSKRNNDVCADLCFTDRVQGQEVGA